MKKRVLILLGGIWHDFEGYAESVSKLLTPSGWEIITTYEMDSLCNLEQEGIDLVISYTCLGKHREGYDDTGPESLTEGQIDCWSSWVNSGGRILAIHSATVLGDSNIKLARLLGGQFLNHPLQFIFTVYPLSRQHPITNEVGAFSILDELYIQNADEDVDIHMVALDRGIAHPMVWSKQEGKGKVVHLAPGHGADVWYHPEFQKLTTQSIDWLFMEEEEK